MTDTPAITIAPLDTTVKPEGRPQPRGTMTSPVAGDTPRRPLKDILANGKTVKTEKPRASRTKKDKGPEPEMPKKGVIADALMPMYASVGMFVAMKDKTCGSAILESAESCAQSIEDLAATNPAVRRAIMSLIKTSAWGGVIAAHAPIIMCVIAHHTGAQVPDMEEA